MSAVQLTPDEQRLILFNRITRAVGSFLIFTAARYFLRRIFGQPPLPRPHLTIRNQKKYGPDTPEVIIVGAGVAGATLALKLGQQRRHVLVIERDMSEPQRIVGEFLQPGGYLSMKQLDIQDSLLGIDAVRTEGYAIYRKHSDKPIILPYPQDPNTQERLLGRAFHNGRMITKLREAAQELPNVKFVEANVKDLIYDKERSNKVVGVRYTKDGKEFSARAPLTMICDGCFSKFRPVVNDALEPKTVTSNFAGVLLKNLELPFEGNAHVFLIEPTPTLFYRISSTEVRTLIDVPEPAPNNVKQYIQEVVATQLPESVRNALLEALEEPNNIKMMPNFKLHPRPLIRPGVIGIGDAYNIRHPLTGGGMTVLFNDLEKLIPLLDLVDDFANEKNIKAVHQIFFERRRPLASTINILAQALYRVFGQGSDDPYVSEKLREACLGYFELGGECVNGPVCLLSGVISSPWVLLYHYARVGLYGAWKMKFQPIVAVRVLTSAIKIFTPLLYREVGSKYKVLK